MRELGRARGRVRASTSTRCAADPAFAQEWEIAKEVGIGALEDECWRRAMHGWLEPLRGRHGGLVRDEGSGEIVMVRRYSDSLLMFLLRATMPERSGRHAHQTPASDTIGITAHMSADRQRELAAWVSATFDAHADATRDTA